MPFAILGFFIAITETNVDIPWSLLAFIVLCMVFARNAAMAFNRYADRIIDENNPRTAMREIPAKQIKPISALIFTIINSLLFIITTFFINKTVFYLSPVALIIILLYSYTKRFTFISHFFLGLGLAIAPAGAYLAVNESLEVSIIILSAIVLCWTAGFDILYSLQDEDFDRKNKLFSIPARFGRKNALLISSVIHFVCTALLILFNITFDSNWIMWIGSVLFISLLIYQHAIVKVNDISRINLAFGTTNGVASVIFVLFAVLSLYL